MQVKVINTQKVLSPTQITLADYAINPYRGCEFGCAYCYIQENKNIKKNADILGIKLNAPCILEKELRYKAPKRVVLGSTTECFQYKELEYRLTEKILRLLNSHAIPYTILTKSHIIAEYLPLIAENKKNKIYFTLNFHCDELIKLFEKKSPLIKQRLRVIREIKEYKIPLRIHIGPFIPYISSIHDIIELVSGTTYEINIEIYHHKMGNFPIILETIENIYNKEMRKKVASVYESENNYLKFAESVREEISNLQKKTSIEFFFILPDFSDYYNSLIDYKDNK